MRKNSCIAVLIAALIAAAGLVYAGEQMVIHFKNGKKQVLQTEQIERIEFVQQQKEAPHRLISGRNYRIIAKHSGKCLEIKGGLPGNTANVEQNDCDRGGNQLWRVIAQGDGYYSLVAVHSGRCLDIWGRSRNKGANAYQYDCHSGNNQQFKITHVGNGFYTIEAKHSGKCLDVEGGKRHNGANVYQWDCHGGDNQLWRFELQ